MAHLICFQVSVDLSCTFCVFSLLVGWFRARVWSHRVADYEAQHYSYLDLGS